MFPIESLTFDANGLIPAIIQDFCSGEVLMTAYMNAESLSITLAEKKTCFYSRSRKMLWRKGESSKNVQHVVSIAADCDADALLVKVIKDGPACHTGKESCFFEEIYRDDAFPEFSLDILYQLLLDRKAYPKEKSYTNYLFDSGVEKILKKVGEESSEVIIASKNYERALAEKTKDKDDCNCHDGKREELENEICDLIFHILVLMAEQYIEVKDIETIFKERSKKTGNLKAKKKVDKNT